MRTLARVILLSFPILASCAPVITPSAMVTNVPTSTSTPAQTITPVPTRTPTPTPTPTPVSPAFTGRIIALACANLFELTASTDSPQADYSLIVSDVSDAAISPDLRYVVYSTFSVDFSNRATHLYDLENQTDAVILPDTAHSFSWSPNSQRFGYIAGFGSPQVADGLYFHEVAPNASRPVFEPPCASYAWPSQRVCGDYSEGFWVSPSTMVFQRFTGAMPETVTSPFFPEVNSNTTTLMSITDGGQVLIDSPRRWFVQDSCGDRILVREETNGSILFSIVDTTEFIAHPGSIEPSLIMSCAEGSSDCLSLPLTWDVGHLSTPYVGFIPGSCIVFHFSGEFPDYFFHILNPETLEDRSFPFPTRGVIAFPSDFVWTADWPDGSDAEILVMRQSLYGPEIEIVNVQTAQKIAVWSGRDMPSISPDRFRILTWIAP
jgi:hypothetical protein